MTFKEKNEEAQLILIAAIKMIRKYGTWQDFMSFMDAIEKSASAEQHARIADEHTAKYKLNQ